MATQLRPLTLGEILDRTALLYRTHFLVFAGIAAVYAGVLLVVALVNIGLRAGLAHAGTNLSRLIQLSAWLGVLLAVIVSSVAGAANNRAVAWVHLGEPATIAGAYRNIAPHAGRYLWLGTLKAMIAWSPMILVYGGMFGALFYLQGKGVLPVAGQAPVHHPPSDPSMMIFGLVFLGLGLLFFPALIYGTWMSIRYALAVPASVVENLRVWAALRRSVELSKGARGGIFALWILVVVIDLGLAGLTQSFFIVYSFQHHLQVPAEMRIAQQVISFFTTTFVVPMLATGTTLFYFDQRVRKEGYDIEWMMQAAGLAQAAVLTDHPQPGEPV
jgi:hypothetical protein